MIEIVRSNDPVELSWPIGVLSDASIEIIVLDSYTSIVEGSIGAIPHRLMVSDDDADRARKILAEAWVSVRDHSPFG